MSALQIPSTRRAASAPTTPATAGDRPVLRLVEDPTPSRSLAPSGPLQAWRRRIGALLVVVAAVFLVAEALTAAPAPVDDAVPVSATTVVVQPGETLWDVARRHAPADVGTAAFVEQVTALNGINGGQVDAWQVLRLPAS